MVFFQHFLKQEAWKAQQWLTWCPPSQAEAQSERWDSMTSPKKNRLSIDESHLSVF